MVKRLNFLLQNQIAWRSSLLKAAAVTLAFFGVYILNFSFWAVLGLFLVLLPSIYFRESPERQSVKVSFWLFPFLGLIALYILKSSFPSNFAVFAVFALLLLFFISLFGLISFIFTNRFLFFGIFNAALFFSLFLEAFYYSLALILSLSWVFTVFYWLALFLAVVFLFKEFFEFYGISLKGKIGIVGVVLGFVVFELFLIVSFLPLGFVNAAAFLTLFALLIRDSLAQHFQGFLNFPFILRELTYFILVGLIIFAASRWGI